MRPAPTLALSLLLIATTASADRVTPKATSTSGVNVRELPTTQSARVDVVAFGESLRYVGSVPYWYEVQLEDGRPGYMSKSASEIIADDEDTEADTGETGPTFTLHAIDAATGLAVLVEGADFFVLYDGGSNDDRRRAVNNRLTNYLALAVPSLTRIDHLIIGLRDSMGMTNCVVTHVMESVRRIADHVVMLDKGEIILDGPLDALESSEDPRIVQFRSGDVQGPGGGKTSIPDYLTDLLG